MENPFLWGAATSSHQIDGSNFHSDWWHWESTGAIERGENSGQATDHWNRFEEDLELARQIGLNTYRFSIEWAKLEPKEGHFDESVLGWYDSLLTYCERLSLLPMATLHHFTIPKWFYDKGGFTHPESAWFFERYVRLVVRSLGRRIPLWCTFNEPMNLTVGQYLGGYMPPAKFWPEGLSRASHQMLKSHVIAYDLIHREVQRRIGPFRNYPLMVGIAHNMMDFLPTNQWNPMERFVVQTLRRFYNRSWLDAITGEKQHFGVTGFIPYSEQVVSALDRRTADFLGINYYTKAYVHWITPGEDPNQSEYIPLQLEGSHSNKAQPSLPFMVSTQKKGEEASDMGWAIHPAGLGRMIRFVKSYGLPIYITENGIADASDKKRLSYLKLHLLEVAREIADGADIRGYYYWSLLDNFEWIKGFEPRFGLIHVDYPTFTRTLRQSADFYRKVIDTHLKAGVPPNPDLIQRSL